MNSQFCVGPIITDRFYATALIRSALMPRTLPQQMEIEAVPSKGKFLLAYGVQKSHGAPHGLGYWSHSLGFWVKRLEEATLFDTQAGALVYRRGNLDRMNVALNFVTPEENGAKG